jgi:hypothetical protein
MDIMDHRKEASHLKIESRGQTRDFAFKPVRRRLFLIGLSLIVTLRVILMLPSQLDFRHFAFRDLGSFQHIDRLIGLGLHPGVDFGFTYGMLGVLFEHIYFAVFGVGHWPTLGLLAVNWVAMLVFWNLLSREIGQSVTNFAVLLGLAAMMIYVEPWPPTVAHILMELSLAFSLYFFLERRLPLALLIAALGALALPSLPIALAGLIALAIAWDWWQTPGRTVRGLLKQFAPAAAGYTAVVALLAVFYGWRTVLHSLLPLGGARHYRAMHFGFFKQGRYFWDPPNPHLSYYLFTPAGVWLFCSGLLVVFGCIGALRIVRTGKLVGHSPLVVVCCALHLVFVFALYGNYLSYAFYSFFLIAGVFTGVSDLTNRPLKIALSSLLLCLGLLSQFTGVSEALQLWKTSSTSPATASLYTPYDFQSEWKGVLSFSKNRRVFLLSYGNGVDHYYPEIGTAQSWLLLPGLPLPREDAYVLQQIRTADVVVEELEVNTRYIDSNQEWQAALEDFPLKVSGRYFRIWTRDRAAQSELLKTATFSSN